MSAAPTTAESTTPSAPVIVVGGGFGGLSTALNLASAAGAPPVLLIEPQERFLFLPLLYELLSGELQRWEIAPRFSTLLAGSGVAWLQQRVQRIEIAMTRRENVIRFLVVRLLLMLTMVIGFWAAMRHPG